MKFKYLSACLLTLLLTRGLSTTNLMANSHKNNLLTLSESGPTKGVYDAVVDIHGSGNYSSIQKAIDEAPSGRTKPYLIFVKSGSYEEVVTVPKEKTFIHLIGQDKNTTVIHYLLNVQSEPQEGSKWYQNDTAAWKYSVHNVASPTYKFPGKVVTILGNDFYCENISFVNDWGVQAQNGPQSLAINTEGDRISFNNCAFRSFQDTWMTSTKGGINNRLYVDRCWIEGAVDYFYGGGNAYVERSTFYNVRSGSVIVAPSHKPGTKYGYIFDRDTIDGNQAAADGKLKLGRPWHDSPIAVYMNSVMRVLPAPEGWTDMGAIPKSFAEYNSKDANGNLVDLSQRRTWFKTKEGRVDGLMPVLTAKDVKDYTYKNVVEDEDGWNPRAYFVLAGKPTSLKNVAGQLSWESAKQAAGYIIYKDHQVVGFSIKPTFKTDGTKGKYIVQSVNQYGSLGAQSDPLSNG